MWLTMCLALESAVCEEPTISLFDMVPGVAQLKSMVQLLVGDADGALKTQTNFLNNGLITSQARTVYFFVTGDPSKAGDIQLTFLGNLECVVDGVPGVGHVKGIYHLLNDETERGLRSIKSSTSSVGTVVGAIGGGPLGAVGGHVVADLLISGVDKLVRGNNSEPHGIVEYVENFSHVDSGGHFDVIAGLAVDAAGAKAAKGKKIRYQRLRDNANPVDGELSAAEAAAAAAASGDSVRGSLDAGQVEPRPNSGSAIAYEFVSNEMMNRMKQLRFEHFVKHDEAYKPLDLAHPSPDKIWTPFALDELRPYSQDAFLQDLDLKTLTGKLKYLVRAEHQSLIERNDFRLINTAPIEFNSLGCAVGGILKMDVTSLQKILPKMSLESYDPKVGSQIGTYLDACKQKKLLAYHRSGLLDGIPALDLYLKTHYIEIENSHIILGKLKSDLKGEAVVLKFKMSPDNQHPVKLMINYQTSPMLTPELPNPFRFENFIDDKVYKSFEVFVIEPKSEIK